jgi:hypothetical protein
VVAASSAARPDTAVTTYGSDNVRHICRLEIPGGGQIVIQDTTAFIGHQHGPDGTTILDIADPRHPKILCKLMMTNPMSHSHKVRVIGDLMVVNSEIEPGKGDRLAYVDGGFRIYDVRNKANPRLLSFTRTYARGVHRFDVDDSYAYISTEMEGFVGNILVIYDIRNPSKPTEVSRWWMPGQNAATGEKPPQGARSFASSRHAMRRRDVRGMLVLRNIDHRCFGHYPAQHTGTLRV